jgi:sugar phosphate isomerase/epimerase
MAGGLMALGAKPRRKHPPFGLQLYSLRHQLEKDLPGTLARVQAMGFRDVESAGYYGLSAEAFAAALRKVGLACRSGHFPYERFRDDVEGVLRDAATTGARFVVCAWIPHDGGFTREMCLRAAEVFTKAGKAAQARGLRFAYHLHGYEFQKSAEGTLFELLVAQTPAALVGFEVDTVWAFAGGADPAALIKRLGSRVWLTHLKDYSRDVKFTPPRDDLPETGNVVLGTGVIDMPAVLAASKRAGVSFHFLEDERTDAIEHLPRSLAYLRAQD